MFCLPHLIVSYNNRSDGCGTKNLPKSPWTIIMTFVTRKSTQQQRFQKYTDRYVFCMRECAVHISWLFNFNAMFCSVSRIINLKWETVAKRSQKEADFCLEVHILLVCVSVHVCSLGLQQWCSLNDFTTNMQSCRRNWLAVPESIQTVFYRVEGGRGFEWLFLSETRHEREAGISENLMYPTTTVSRSLLIIRRI